MLQLPLKAKGCSGRGVRIQVLTVAQRQSIKTETAKDLGPSSTMAEWMGKQIEQGICAMVLAVTEKDGFANKTELLADSVAWKKYSADDLAEKLTQLFTTKDLDALGKIFTRLHDVTDSEVDDILGEALEVTAA